MSMCRSLTSRTLLTIVCLTLVGCAGSPLREDPGAVALYMATGGLVGQQRIRQMEQEQRARNQAKSSDRFGRKLSDEQRIDAVVRLAATKFFLQTGSGGRFNVSDEAGINALTEKLRQSFSSRRYLLGTELRTVTLPSDTQLRTFALCFGPYWASEPKIREQLGQQCLLAAGLTDAVYREVVHSLLDVSLISVIRSDATIRTYVLADVAYAKNNREEARSREGIPMTSEPKQEQSLQALTQIIEIGKRRLSSGRNHDFACAAAAQQLGAHYLNRGNLIKASIAYTDAISCDALDLHAWEARATVEERRGNGDYASRYRGEAARLRSLSMTVPQIEASIEHPAPAFHYRGQLAYKSGQYAEAIELFTKEIDWYRQHAPTSRQLTDAIIARADAYVFNNQSQRAKDDLDAAIAATSDPELKQRYLLARSKHYSRRKQFDLADADSQAARAIMMGTLVPQAEAKRSERMEEVRRAQEAVSETLQTAAQFAQPQPPVTPRNPLEPALNALKVSRLAHCNSRWGPYVVGSGGSGASAQAKVWVVMTGVETVQDLEIIDVNLPVELTNELIRLANQSNARISMALGLPFFQWLVRARGDQYDGRHHSMLNIASGNWQAEFATGCASADSHVLKAAGRAGATMAALTTLLAEGNVKELRALIGEYLDTIPAEAKQQNRQPVDAQPRASCGKSTFTVAEGVSVSWTCDKQGGIAITEAKLPVAVGQELLAQAAQHGVKVSFDLTLPFFAWWVKQPVQSSLTVRDQKKLGPDGVAVSDHLHDLLNLLRESRFAELRQIIGQYFATLTAAQPHEPARDASPQIVEERSGKSAIP